MSLRVSNSNIPDVFELSSPMLPQSPSNTPSKPPSKREMSTRLSIFLLRNPSVILALVGGLLCTFACFGFTLWLSREVFSCPDWSVDCSVDPKVQWIVQNYGLVQGTVTAFSGIGIASMGYAAFQLGETMLWPVLHRQLLTLDELATHISASRGSIPSLFQALASIRSVEALSIILCVAIVIGTQQANSVVVGQVYTRTPVPTVHKSNHSIGGGGMDGEFKQRNPPTAFPFSVSTASSLYASWSFGYSEEPLQQYRDYIFDRKAFFDLGLTNFSITTVKVQRYIACDGFSVNISNDKPIKPHWFYVNTGFKSGPVKVRRERRTAVWVDNIQYINDTRAISTLVFAALDGHIEKGTNTRTPPRMQTEDINISNISAVACSVDVTLINNQHVGDDSDDTQTSMILDFNTMTDSQNVSDLGQTAAWLGVAVTAFGDRIQGAQPMFEPQERNNASRLPQAYTLALPSGPGNKGDNWKIAEIENFINIGSGAVAMSIAHYQKPKQNYTLVHSRQADLRLHPSRPYILLYLTAPVLTVVLLLSWLSVWVHCNEDVPSLNTANVTEIIVSSRALDLQKLLCDAESKKEIMSLKVKYKRMSEGPVEFGLYAAH